ncbi:MAG: hypothetical protein WAM63_17050, partial [Rhodomicrobium sp.]
ATTVSVPTILLADILYGSSAIHPSFIQEYVREERTFAGYQLQELIRWQVAFFAGSTSDTLQANGIGLGLADNTATLASITGVFEPIIFDFRPYSSAAEFRQLWREAQQRLLLARIDSFERRVEGWDGSGGTPPNAEAVRDAKVFLLSLAADCALPSKTFAPGDGEVIFQWRQRGAFAEVGFYGDRTISWYARIPDKEPLHSDNPFIRERADEISADLRAVLRALV